MSERAMRDVVDEMYKAVRGWFSACFAGAATGVLIFLSTTPGSSGMLAFDLLLLAIVFVACTGLLTTAPFALCSVLVIRELNLWRPFADMLFGAVVAALALVALIQVMTGHGVNALVDTWYFTMPSGAVAGLTYWYVAARRAVNGLR